MVGDVDFVKPEHVPSRRTTKSDFSERICKLNKQRFGFHGLAAWLAIVVLTGCGDSNWASVEGTVTLDGKPVGPGNIAFNPVNPQSGGGGFGAIDADGHFTLTSSGSKPGIAVGEYKVLVRGPDAEDPEAFGSKPPKSDIPPRYGNPRGSDLVQTIVPGSQKIEIVLTR